MDTSALTQVEITGAVTDLLLGVILIPLIITLKFIKTDKALQKKWWFYFLLTLDIACILGFLAHYCFTEPIPNRIIWIPLFTIMYEAVNCFFLSCTAVATNGKRPYKKDVLTVHLVSLACYILTHIIVGVFGADSIMVMTCFNSVIALVGFSFVVKKAIKKGNKSEKLIVSSLIPLLPAAYFQIKRQGFVHIIWDFNHNGISHLLITAGVLILFAAIVVCLKTENKKD